MGIRIPIAPHPRHTRKPALCALGFGTAPQCANWCRFNERGNHRGYPLALGVGVGRECVLVFLKCLRVFRDSFFVEAFSLRAVVVVVVFG